MDYFEYRGGRLFAENVAVADVADEVGTPAYIYSERTLHEHYDKIAHAFRELDPLICYSVKSLSNLSILRLLAQAGAGFDVVSGGELFRVLKAGCQADRCVFAGVGKTNDEIRQALDAGVLMLNVESDAEFENIDHIARQMQRRPRCALRINPAIDTDTHPHTATGRKDTKFGIDIDRAEAFFRKYHKAPAARLVGAHLHIGSPVRDPRAYVQAIGKVLPLIDALKAGGIRLDTLDIGGGYAASYETSEFTAIEDYADAVVPLLKDKGLKVVLEPGRVISANAGILLGRVQYVKTVGGKTFAVLDTGMHHLIRPPLYDAFHFVWPAEPGEEMTPPVRTREPPLQGLQKVDVVGPICESGDFLAKDRPLPPLKRGDLVAVFGAGAYGMVMASNYNSQPRPAEVLVTQDAFRIIRRRENYEDLIRGEE